MSYLSNALVPCQTLQARLENLWIQEGPTGADDDSALARWIVSTGNTQGIKQTILPGNGKKRTVELTYFQRLTESDVAEDVSNPLCTASDKYGNLSTTYEMPDTNIGDAKLVTVTDLTNFCEGNGSYFERIILNMMDVVERKTMTQWSEEAILLAGQWGALGMSNSLFDAGSAVGDINGDDEFVWATRYEDGKIDPEAWWELRFALNKIGYGDQVAIIGGSTGFKYFGATQVGCCADQGIDVASAMMSYGYGVAYDRRLANAFQSEDKLLVLEPGRIVPLTYVLNPWKDGVPPIVSNAATFIHTTGFTPRLGIPVDITINHPCGNDISIGVVASTKLIATPLDQFQSNDPYFGKNGVAKVLIDNP